MYGTIPLYNGISMKIFFISFFLFIFLQNFIYPIIPYNNRYVLNGIVLIVGSVVIYFLEKKK